MMRFFICLGIAFAVCVGPSSAQDDDFVATSGKFNFKLRNGKELSGFMAGKSTIDLLFAGLEIKVPVRFVKSIRFGGEDATRMHMQLNNGDSLSAQIMPSKLGVVAEWGSAEINSRALAQMTRVALVPAVQSDTTRATNSSSAAAATATEVVPASPVRNRRRN